MAQESIPLKYVDSLSDKKHLVLLYDDEEYAQRIEFEFLKKGLMTGDSCIYATEMDLEREFHSNFSTFDGYIVCPYDISKLRVHRENKWIQYLFETHHATIYALKSNQGGAFYLQ